MDEVMERLRMLLDQLPSGFIVLDGEAHGFLFCSKECEILTGYRLDALESILRDSPASMVFPKDREAFVRNWSGFIRDGKPDGGEYRFIRFDGKIVWLRFSCSRIRFQEKDFILFSCIDVTEEKSKAELLDFIADNVASSISFFSIDDGKLSFLYGNDLFFSLFGTTRSYYMEHCDEVNRFCVTPEDSLRIENAIKDALQRHTTVEVEHQVHCLDGRTIWVRRRISAKARGEEEYAFISIVDDITKQKEEAIRRELVAERQDLVIDELKAAVFEWNWKTHAFYCSKTYREYSLSKEPPEAIVDNKGSLDAIHPEDIPAVMRFFKETKQGKARAETEIRLRLTTGGYRWVRMIGLFKKDREGKDERIIGIIIDINRDKENSVMMNSLVNAIPGGVAVSRIGSSIKTLYSSEGVPKISGRTMQEYENWVQGDILANTVYVDDIPRVREAITKAVLGGGQINVLYRLKHKDGSLVWVQLQAEKIREEDGDSIYYAVYTQPSAETQLYQRIVDDSLTAIFVAEMETRRILYANRAWRKLEGVPMDKMIVGHSLFDVIPKSRMLFSLEAQKKFPTDSYQESYVLHESGAFLHLFVRSILWNGIHAYMLYASDETKEHERKVELQELVDHVPGGIGIYTIRNNHFYRTYMNDGYFKLLGWENVKYKDVEDHIHDYVHVHPDDLPDVIAENKKFLTSGGKHSFSYRCQNASGGYTWIRTTGIVVESLSGPSLLYCSFSNVDAEKNAELQYRKQIDDSNRFAAENLLVKARYDLERNQVEYREVKNGDPVFSHQPLSYDDALAFMADGSLLPSYRQQMLSLFDRQRLIRECKAGHGQSSMEYPKRMDSGRICWIEMTSRMFQEPVTNDVIGFLYVSDVSDRVVDRKITERLNETQYEQIVLLDFSAHEITIKNVREKRVGKEPFGIMTQKRINNSFLSEYEVTGDDLNQLQEMWDLSHVRSLLEAKGSYGFAVSGKGKDGVLHRKQIWYMWLDEIREVILVTVSDITLMYEKEQKQLETLKEATLEAKRADQAKTDFLSRVSHDMRTPLNGILGLTQLMKEEDDIPSIRKDIGQLELSGSYLLNLVSDTLDVSKIEKGQLQLHPIVCDGTLAWKNVYELVKPNLVKKDLDFRMHADAFSDRPLFVDIGRLEQVFMNLVGNAVKFTPEGGRIDFTMEHLQDGPESQLDKFIIRDNGIGMSDEFLPHVFEPFMQEHGNKTSIYGGSGLGTTICKQIITLMGGSITVESALGVGTVFTIVIALPYATPQQIEDSTKEGQEIDLSLLKGRHVLVCEDHPINAEITKRLLEKVGIVSDRAENGEQGVQLFGKSPVGSYDAILMDIRMPVVDGLEATRRIRSLDRSDAAVIPIIAMTANAMDEDIRQSKDAGMNAHLAKPFQAKDLFAVLGRLIGNGRRFQS